MVEVWVGVEEAVPVAVLVDVWVSVSVTVSVWVSVGVKVLAPEQVAPNTQTLGCSGGGMMELVMALIET